MRALLPFTGVLQDRNKYLLISTTPCRIHLYWQNSWLHGDFVVWVWGAPNTLDWWRLNFFDHTARLLFISRWIRYVRVIQWWMLDAVSSKHSLSVLLSAVETNHTTQTALVLACWPSHKLIAYVCRVLFLSELLIVWLLIVWLLFEGSLLCGYYWKLHLITVCMVYHFSHSCTLRNAKMIFAVISHTWVIFWQGGRHTVKTPMLHPLYMCMCRVIPKSIHYPSPSCWSGVLLCLGGLREVERASVLHEGRRRTNHTTAGLFKWTCIEPHHWSNLCHGLWPSEWGAILWWQEWILNLECVSWEADWGIWWSSAAGGGGDSLGYGLWLGKQIPLLDWWQVRWSWEQCTVIKLC